MYLNTKETTHCTFNFVEMILGFFNKAPISSDPDNILNMSQKLSKWKGLTDAYFKYPTVS